MKTGISTATLSGCNETEDALKIISDIGADSCEAYLQTFYEYRPEFSKKFRGNAEGCGVVAVRVNPLNFEAQLFSPSRRVRGDGFYWLDQLLRSAQLLGAKSFAYRGFAREEDFDGAAGYLNGIIGFCARYNVTLCLESAGSGLYNRPSVFAELKKRCPQLSGVFDMWQARSSGCPYAMYIEDMKGGIAYARLSDLDENGRACLPGTGISDFCEILKRLKGAGFDGSLIIDAPAYGDISALANSLEFLRGLIDKIN